MMVAKNDAPMPRELQKDGFLMHCGWGEARRSFLSGDASFRSYDRVRLPRPMTITLPDGSGEVESMDLEFAVLMDAPPEKEDTAPFIRMTHFLRQAGLRAPAIIAQDVKRGFLLLEDLGDGRFSQLLQGNVADASLLQAEQKYYHLAIDALIHLHGQGAPEGLAHYDVPLMMREVALFTDWYLPWLENVSGHAVPVEASRAFKKMIEEALLCVPPAPQVTVLRDYHADNLLMVHGAHGLQALGVLDYQDAVIGSPVYDIVSLLEDARRDIAGDNLGEGRVLTQSLLTYYQRHLPEMPMADLLQHFHVLGLQRNLKILGIFCRLAKRDGKPHYLKHLPRVFNHVMHDVQHPALSEVAGWLDTYIPASLRGLDGALDA